MQTFLLDVTDFSEKKAPSKLQDLSQDDARQNELAGSMVDVFRDEVCVVLLGALVDGVDEDMDVMAGLIVHRKP